MQLKLPRYHWWLLLLVGIAGLASWFLWPKSVMQERYERIRIGMTPAEVALTLGSAPSGRYRLTAGTNDETEVWVDESVYIYVFCSQGKAVLKRMDARVPPCKTKARIWFYRLRGLVGW
jgi:hypothetical protein